MKESQTGLDSDRMEFLKVAARVDARYRQFPSGKFVENGRWRRPTHPSELFTYISYSPDEGENVRIQALPVDYRFDNFSEFVIQERPQWLRRIAETMLVIQEQRVENDTSSIVDQMTDPLNMMGSSLKFSETKDAIAWGKFRDSLISITWPQTTHLSTEEIAESQAELFSREVSVWLELGITSDTINDWFRCIESILSLPGLHTKYLSQRGFFGEPMLADTLPHTARKNNVSRLYDHGQPYQRIQMFAQTVGQVVDDSSISDSAFRVATIADSLIENKFPQPLADVPTSYKNYEILVANALERSLSHGNRDYDKIAAKLVRFLRRNHVQFGYDEVIEMCASFFEKGGIETHYGTGLDCLDELRAGARDELTAVIQHCVVPRILQTIVDQRLLRNGNPSDAKKLKTFLNSVGLDEQEHQGLKGEIGTDDFDSFLQSKHIANPTLQDKIAYIRYCQESFSFSQIGEHDMVVKVSMTGQPPTYAHLELLHDLLDVSKGKVWVIVEPNNNPSKKHTHGTLADRWIAAYDSFAHIPGVIMMPLSIDQGTVSMGKKGTTFERLKRDQAELEVRGFRGTIYRGCGIEKLDPECGWRYGPSERSADIGNHWPHIFLADKLIGDYWSHAPEIIQKVLQQFPGTTVLVSPVLNHGTNIRRALESNHNLHSIYLA